MLTVYDEAYTLHLQGVAHIERPQRVSALFSHLESVGLTQERVPAREATDEELGAAHSRRYVDLVRIESERTAHHGPGYLSTGDTAIGPRSSEVARRAAGGSVAAMENAIAKKRAVFALVRPPGHHAEAARGMGFCIFNNAVVAARAFVNRTGERVLIADFDYHHGNGTQALCGEGLSYLSTHAFPAYPGTGGHEENYDLGADAIVNIPLPEHNFGSEAFVALWDSALRTVAQRVRPKLLIVSAGYDILQGDPIGDLGVSVAAAASLGRIVRRVADEFCGGAAVFVLEGGYDARAMALAVEQTIRGHDSGKEEIEAEVRAVPAAQHAIVQKVASWN